MVTKKVIKCSSCGEDSGHCEEDFRMILLKSDVHCKKCDAVVIKMQPKPMY